jgi:hypothetical protein
MAEIQFGLMMRAQFPPGAGEVQKFLMRKESVKALGLERPAAMKMA